MSNKGPTRRPHTACRRGKRVRVVLMNGESFVDKFWDKTDKFIVFAQHPKILAGSIKSFTIVKGNPLS